MNAELRAEDLFTGEESTRLVTVQRKRLPVQSRVHTLRECMAERMG